MSTDALKVVQEKDRKRKMEIKKDRSEDEKEEDRRKAKEMMRKYRAKEMATKDEKNKKNNKSDQSSSLKYGETERYASLIEQARSRTKKMRENQTHDDKLLENEEARGRMRKIRGLQKEDQRRIENEKANERMRKLRISRYLIQQEESMERKEEKGLPDIVERLNQKARNDKEVKRNKEASTSSEECEETYQEQELKPNETSRSLKKDEVNEYNRKKYHERMSKFEEKTIFNRINRKYEQRERRLKGTIDDNELEEKKDRNQADQVQELYRFF